MDTASSEADPNGLNQHEPGAKLDRGKIMPRLILHDMSRAISAVSGVGTYGATKYTEGGWRHVNKGFERYTDAMMRHLLKEGVEMIDQESGLLHAAQVAWNALARLELLLSAAEVPTGTWLKMESLRKHDVVFNITVKDGDWEGTFEEWQARPRE